MQSPKFALYHSFVIVEGTGPEVQTSERLLHPTNPAAHVAINVPKAAGRQNFESIVISIGANAEEGKLTYQG
jgi:hypothetical protein